LAWKVTSLTKYHRQANLKRPDGILHVINGRTDTNDLAVSKKTFSQAAPATCVAISAGRCPSILGTWSAPPGI